MMIRTRDRNEEEVRIRVGYGKKRAKFSEEQRRRVDLKLSNRTKLTEQKRKAYVNSANCCNVVYT